MQHVKMYSVTLVMFFLVDMVWLGVISKSLYSRYLGHLMAPSINWTAALIFYALYIAGLVFFVIDPALDRSSLVWAIGAGAFFGLVAYATYDLTNLATIKDWPVTITVIDLAWGTFLNGTTAGLTFLVIKNWLS